MKRYLLSILLGLFIATGISTYYVYGTMNHFPEFVLSTVQGDAQEGEQLELSGHYSGKMWGIEPLSVTVGGSHYESEQSMYEQHIALSWFYSQPDVQEMIKDHRSFMRGKRSIYNFYKDEKRIIYAEASLSNKDASNLGIKLNVEVLDRTSGKVSHHTSIVNVQTVYSQVYITDIQLHGDEIHIMAYHFPKMDPITGNIDRDSEKFHDYVMNIDNGKVIRDFKLDERINPEANVELQLSMQTNENPSAPGEYAVLNVRKFKRIVTENEHREENLAENLYSYSYKTGDLTALPEQLVKDLNDNSSFNIHGNVLSILNGGMNVVQLKRYNLATRQEEPGIAPLTPEQLGADSIGTILIHNERVFVLLHKDNIPMVAVLNASNGDVLYMGKVSYDGPSSEADEYLKDMQMLNISIRTSSTYQ